MLAHTFRQRPVVFECEQGIFDIFQSNLDITHARCCYRCATSDDFVELPGKTITNAGFLRAWRVYDHGMNDWPTIRDKKWLVDAPGSAPAAKYWTRLFEETWQGNIDTWDYRWTFAVWREAMITILPKVNLIKNIGFRCDATYTAGSNVGDPSSMTQPIDFPLRHPSHMIIDRIVDTFTINSCLRQHSFLRRVIYAPYRLFQKATCKNKKVAV